MVAGEAVFESARAMTAIVAQASEAPVPLTPKVSSTPLGHVIERAVRKAPEKRYQSAGEMLDALRGLGVLERTPSVSAPSRTTTRLASALEHEAAVGNNHSERIAELGQTALGRVAGNLGPSCRAPQASISARKSSL